MRLQSIAVLTLIAAASAATPRRPVNMHTASGRMPPPASAQTCAGCHGPQGQGGNIFPRLAGQPAEYLQRQLKDFRSGRRTNSMMQPVAENLSDGDIDRIAHYFSALKAAFGPAQHSAPANELARGQELVTMGDWREGAPACMRCHGPELAGVRPEIPALAGQPTAYIIARLQTFKDTDTTSPPEMIMRRAGEGLSGSDLQAVTAYVAQLRPGERLEMTRPSHDATYKFIAQSPDSFKPPPESAVPVGPEGEMIWRGLMIFENTRHLAGSYVGDALNCASCHLDHGRRADSAPMWAAYVAYPKYREKDHKVNTLEERIQGCFRYSMNGTPPPADSPEMQALVTYFHWLATGLPVGIAPKGAGYPQLPPSKHLDIRRGATVYLTNCSMCHGDNGQGTRVDGEQVFPPLWGMDSFNWGAGMEHVSVAAGFIKANMPYGAGDTLSDQDAWDVAAFVVSHERPQDPRFTGNVKETREEYHAHDSYYGRFIDGHLLGSTAKPHG